MSPDLTPREIQVLDLLARGWANKRIAWHLHLTEGTIKFYINSIFKKTGKQGRVMLVLWWISKPGILYLPKAKFLG